MRVQPETVVDRGYWISDDRVYAFVGAGEKTIEEVGYHGSQPVSRNSRILGGSAGVCRFAVHVPERQSLRFEEYEWLPGSMRLVAPCGGGEVRLTLTTAGRRLVVTGVMRLPGPGTLSITFPTAALFSDVHGTRIWEREPPTATHVLFRFRDCIYLDDWLRREGPYGVDFLIPEPMRRQIFGRRCRSGTATKEDLLPGLRDAHVPIYDATGFVRIGGGGYARTEGPGHITFTASPINDRGEIPPFAIAFDDGGIPSTAAVPPESDAEAVHRRHEQLLLSAPGLRLEECPNTEQFFSTVPGLVDSCIVRDLGLPRANPGRYYWIWAWDAMVTAMSSLRWGGHARGTADFVDRHRDEDGRIPMRWTRTLEPLDSQDHGSLDVLLFSLVYATWLETRDVGPLRASYQRMVSCFDTISARCNERGMFANIGFYPDLPIRFHRTETSAVAMEVGNFYTFCRTLENTAILFGDRSTERRAAAMVDILERSFLEAFWDADQGFLIDSLDIPSGKRNTSYPLFGLLFLHSPLGLSLVRSRMGSVGRFVVRHLLTPEGMRLLPAWDKNTSSETVTGAWYPHWDVYAITVLRRTGRGKEIASWIRSVEKVLGRLGYAPEYLVLGDLAEELAWQRHGAASNLNCVTGWYQALLTGLCGLECDPGGLTILPLGLPLGNVSLTDIHYRGTRWNLTVNHGGPFLEDLRVDGEQIRGTTKIPSRFYDGADHLIEVQYGNHEPGLRVVEFTNAELLEIGEGGHELKFNAHGRCDVLFSHSQSHGVFLDGRQVGESDLMSGTGLRLRTPGQHLIRI